MWPPSKIDQHGRIGAREHCPIHPRILQHTFGGTPCITKSWRVGKFNLTRPYPFVLNVLIGIQK